MRSCQRAKSSFGVRNNPVSALEPEMMHRPSREVVINPEFCPRSLDKKPRTRNAEVVVVKLHEVARLIADTHQTALVIA